MGSEFERDLRVVDGGDVQPEFARQVARADVFARRDDGRGKARADLAGFHHRFAVGLADDRAGKKRVARAGRVLDVDLSINTGRLGFMASLESDCLEKLLLLKSGQFEITERMLLHGILHDETRIYEFDALNDINVSGMYSKICDFSNNRARKGGNP